MSQTARVAKEANKANMLQMAWDIEMASFCKTAKAATIVKKAIIASKA